MKKSAKIRLTLHRETLRNLSPDQLRNAGGGERTDYCLTAACQTTDCFTQTCPTVCVCA
jgi:hypothetical protein